METFSVKSARFLCFWSVQVAQGGIELGPRRSQEFRGSPELQNGGLRMEDYHYQIGGLRSLAKLRMAGFWMHQVRLLGQQLGDRMGETKIVQLVALLRAQYLKLDVNRQPGYRQENS